MINTYDLAFSHHRFRLFKSQLGLPANFYDCNQVSWFVTTVAAGVKV